MFKKVLLVLAILAVAVTGYALQPCHGPMGAPCAYHFQLGIALETWEQVVATAVQMLVIPLTVLFVWLARTLIPVLPRALLPVLAVALGTGLDWLLVYTTGGTFSPVIGALLGASAVWLREFTNTIREHGLRHS